ncbi:hypothetical protein N1851_022337 [Merluccius polli]|uniref:Uncharacterized protein n=1 Tax=Merluccius polli TaxID=89951 RepID=A0AA47MI03_MERPO|nr:hypothetical protein N1851_022337 [Merluccius polli]
MVRTLLERQRRGVVAESLSRLQREVGLEDKTPQVIVLKQKGIGLAVKCSSLGEQKDNGTSPQAHEEVHELRRKESSLQRLKRSLRTQREERIRTLAHTTGKTEDSISRELLQLANRNAQQGQTGIKPPLAAEVVIQLDKADEQTKDPSDEENLPSGTHDNVITNPSDDDIDIETVEDNGSLTEDDRKCLVTAFRTLRSALNTKTRTRLKLLDQAFSVICELEKEEQRFERMKVALKRQRSTLINNISARSGENVAKENLGEHRRSNKKILDKLQSITAKQRELEEMRSKALPEVASTPLDLTTRIPPPQPQAPQAAQMGLQLPLPTSITHNALVQRNRRRTFPNILIRKKPSPQPPPQPHPSLPSPPPSAAQSGEAAAPPGHSTLTPAELVSFVRALPGQQVLSLNPMASGPGALPPNPAGPFPTLVYLVPPPTDLQQLQENATEQLGPLPHLQTPLSAGPSSLLGQYPTRPSSLLCHYPTRPSSLLCHYPTRPPSLLCHYPTRPPSLLCHYPTRPPSLLCHYPTRPSSLLGHYPTRPSALLGHYRTRPSLLGHYPTRPSSLLGHYPTRPFSLLGHYPTRPFTLLGQYPTRPPSVLGQYSINWPSFLGRLGANVKLSPSRPPTETQPGSLSPEEQQQQQQEEEQEEERGEVEGEGLSSLLNELSFLNQNHTPPADQPLFSSVPRPLCSSLGGGVGGGGGGAREPLLKPSLSNEDLMEAARVNGHMQSADGPEPNGYAALHYPQCSSKGDTLTPPPLLQMKVGGAKLSKSTNERAAGAWKPMPRLAAMGVKGGPPT